MENQIHLIAKNLRKLAEHFEAYLFRIEAGETFISPNAADPNTLNIDGLTQKQILRAVAEKRLEQYPTQGEAAKSLGIDIRTLKKYRDYQEAND